MTRTVLPFLAALALCAFGSVALAAPGDGDGSGRESMQVWASDHEAMLNARLAGLKAGPKLTPDQEKLWPPFEAAVRDAAKLRMDQMKDRMERVRSMRDMDMTQPAQGGGAKDMGAGREASPVDRLEALAKRMSQRGAAMLIVAEAAKPFYASLDDTQKRLFGLLGGDMLLMGPGRHGMGTMGKEGMGRMEGQHRGSMGMMGGDMGMMRGMGMGMMGGGRGMMGDEGIGMMQGGHQGVEMMRNQPDDEGDTSDDR